MKATALAVLVAALVFTGGQAARGASSEDNRAERTFLLEWTPIGLHPATLLVSPALGGSGMLGAGIYLGKNWLVGIEYGSNSY